MLQNKFACFDYIDHLGLSKPFITISHLERAWWVRRKVPSPETVAQHSLNSAMLIVRFQEEVRKRWISILELQTYLLIHDLQEGNPLVGDITHHDNISKEEKRRREEAAIIEILWENSPLLDIWYRWESEWSLGKEIEKYQAIEQAAIYEKQHFHLRWVTEEFSDYSVKNGYITSNFLITEISHILNSLLL